MALRAEKMAERRERILASAREILAERGFEALTTRELAARARVTVPTIYNLIGPKDAVLFAAVEETTARFLEGVGERADLAPAERILAVGEDSVAELVADPRYYKTLLPLLFTSSAARAARVAVAKTMVSRFRLGVDALAEAGDLVEWASPAEVAGRLSLDLTAVALSWAAGDLDEDAFRHAASLGSATILLGLTQGAAHDVVERIARAGYTETAERAGSDGGPESAPTARTDGSAKRSRAT